jgi:hypothetical protein
LILDSFSLFLPLAIITIFPSPKIEFSFIVP